MPVELSASHNVSLQTIIKATTILLWGKIRILFVVIQAVTVTHSFLLSHIGEVKHMYISQVFVTFLGKALKR